MRVVIQKSTGLILLSCTTSSSDALLQSVIDSGLAKEEVEIRKVTQDEYEQLLASQPEPRFEPTLEQRNRADIDYIGMMTGVL